MTKEEISKCNTLIAEYEGKEFEGFIQDLDWGMGTGDYHKNFVSLMRVVNKIVSVKFEDGDNAYLRQLGMISDDGKFMARFNRSGLHRADTLHEALWLAVVEWCKDSLDQKANKS